MRYPPRGMAALGVPAALGPEMAQAGTGGAAVARMRGQQRRMRLTREGPLNPDTIDYCGAFVSLDEDNSWDYAAFKRGFSIRVTRLSDEVVEFDMVGIDPPLANAFRRLLLGEVPTVAISEVTVYQNTGVLHDENLVHRIGLCPIRFEPDRLEAKLPDMEFNETNSLKFRLHAVCGAKPRRVLSSDLVWVPWSPAQKELFGDAVPALVADNILITQLRPGQEIELECFCAKGTGREHAKWSPVSTASYRLQPYADLSMPILDDDAERLAATCRMGVFDIEELPGGGKRAVVGDPRLCNTCRECLESFEGEAKGLEIGKIKDHYLFTVESNGSIPAPVLFEKAVMVLKDKCTAAEGVLRQRSEQ